MSDKTTPKIRLPYAVNRLQLVASVPSGNEDVTNAASAKRPIRGVGYSMSELQQLAADTDNAQGGLLSDDRSGLFVSKYEINPSFSEVDPIAADKNIFCWDTSADDDGCWADNELQLLDLKLGELKQQQLIGGEVFLITPEFSVNYKTDCYPAYLGEIRLVESSRFALDVYGNQHHLINTQENSSAVLYLTKDNNSVVRQIKQLQPVGSERQYCFNEPVFQHLIPEVNGCKTRSITILEKYTSFIMQKPAVVPPMQSIWTSGSFPITWGWSIRIELEGEEWTVVRRKLINPVVGHDGFELPQWNGAIVDF